MRPQRFVLGAGEVRHPDPPGTLTHPHTHHGTHSHALPPPHPRTGPGTGTAASSEHLPPDASSSASCWGRGRCGTPTHTPGTLTHHTPPPLGASALSLGRILRASTRPAGPALTAASPRRQKVAAFARENGFAEEAFLRALTGPAAAHARPPVSDYHVGAAALGESGQVYLGVNLEFPEMPLNQSVHAEQFAIVNSLLHNEPALKALAVTAAPCGHCRQFMCELTGSEALRLLVGAEEDHSLHELLPHNFGPEELQGPDPQLVFQPIRNGLEWTAAAARVVADLGPADRALAEAALAHAERAYAPYSQCPAGVALRARGGLVAAGGSIESAAFNPSMLPLQSALVDAVVKGVGEWGVLERMVVVERHDAGAKYHATAELLLGKIAPAASVLVLDAQRRA